jgi:hypothetical protein
MDGGRAHSREYSQAVSRPRRRLTDKVLAAHAEALNEGDSTVGSMLRNILSELDRHEGEKFGPRRQLSAVEQADRWAVFVSTREEFRTALALDPPEPQRIADSYSVMKTAYLAWSAT